MTVAEILKKWSEHKKVSDKECRELYKQLYTMCRDKFSSYFEETEIEDIVSNTVLIIYKSIESQKSDFWKNLSSKANEQVTAYIYQIMRTSSNKSKDIIDKKESRIVNAISKNLSKLEKEGVIIKIEKHFAVSGVKFCKEFYNGSISLPYQSLRRGQTMLDHTVLLEYMKIVIERLGNKCFSKSDMIHLIRENTDEFGSSIIESEEIDIPSKDSDTKDSNLIEEMLLKFNNCFSESERIERALIFVCKLFYQFTLMEIKEILMSYTSWNSSSLQSISNAMKDVSNCIGLNRASDDNTERSKLFNEFVTRLSQIYFTDDIHEQFQQIKNKHY